MIYSMTLVRRPWSSSHSPADRLGARAVNSPPKSQSNAVFFIPGRCMGD